MRIQIVIAYIISFLLVLTACSPKGVKPSVEIISPTLGSIIREGKKVRVIAEAKDQDGLISHVDFFVDDTFKFADKKTSYQFDWLAEAGKHQIKAVAYDHQGLFAEDTLTLSVVKGDGKTPLANFTASPDEGSAPLEVGFDASASSDPNGTLVRYLWDLGDGTMLEGKTVSHVYTRAGEFEAKLTVEDDEGLRDSSAITITVMPSEKPEQPPGQPEEAITLPIEVMGEKGYIKTLNVTLQEAATHIYFQCHRCAYKDSSVNVKRGSKASVRINEGAWLDLSDAMVSVFEPEKSYGGIAGGFHTVRFTLPVSGLLAGKNRLDLRFNGTDGHSNGYRIIDLNFLKGQKKLLTANDLSHHDPSLWQPPLANARDIALGKTLWETASLRESPLSSKRLNARCSSCHAKDGRDLKYFNYSNWSIIERSKFHGLSELEGKQIASYIRQLDVPAPKQARPWNPPYQPGPGLDSKPLSEWSAGAGLEWVLNHDREMLPYLFPKGTSPTALSQVIDTKATLNMRELPVAIQLPDWNAWLPDTHPVDLWGDFFTRQTAYSAYLDLDRNLQQKGVQSLIAEGELLAQLDEFRNALNRDFIVVMNGPEPCRVYYGEKNYVAKPSPAFDNLPKGKTCEDGMQSLNLWSAVKHWEIMQRYQLEDKAPRLYRYGEQRSWPGNRRQVFEVAPHRSANNAGYFQHQTKLNGVYDSTAWYHVQLVINSGNREQKGFFPQDWAYTPAFIHGSKRDSGQAQALRLTSSMIKMYQTFDRLEASGDKPSSHSWWIRFINPRYLDNVHTNLKATLWEDLDRYEPNLRRKVIEAFLTTTLKKTLSYPVESWPRSPANAADSSRAEPLSYRPTAYSGEGTFYDGNANSVFRVIPKFRAIGVDEALLKDLIDWGQAMWPLGDWNSLRKP